MRTKSSPLLPPLQALLAKTGENIRNARLRRRLNTTLVAERAHLSRPTLIDIEPARVNGLPVLSGGAPVATVVSQVKN